ncbi:Cof-type HAD-IIB family hydrolase [Anaerovorax odorimutans]|uniref:Cof-type HAD-IIB family hydrolase n=1 Tax=Anaerovorax odorimutans TaxID=109327 RepID=UPI00040C1D75|nr:Cof-type HAD-IIB family hydrolase [Anaerovorax odorimutans]
MNIKLIALDMDGTLLSSQGTLSNKNKEIINEAMKRGINIVIATGRVLSALPKDVIAVSGIEYAVTSNGARVVRLEDNHSLYTNLISEEKINDIKEFVFADDVFLEIFFDGDVFVDKYCLEKVDSYNLPKWYSDYVLKTRTPVEDLKETLEANLGAMENININFSSMERRSEFLEKLKKIEGITITTSLPHNIEIGGATTSKADGVTQLCNLLSLKSDNVMAFGDSQNDGAMLSFAGLAVAMDNASKEVKHLADYITKSNDEDGVAYAIEKFIL